MGDSITDADEAAAKRARRNAYIAEWRTNNPDRWKAIASKSRAKHRDKISAANAKWAAANPDRVKAKMTKWREANRETARAATIRWRTNHPDRARAAVKRWTTENAEHNKALKAARRARELSAEGVFTGEDVKDLLKKQRGKCAYCRISLRNGYHVDHIVPLARGGSNWPKNLQLTCKRCNNRKHAKHPNDFARENGMLI